MKINKRAVFVIASLPLLILVVGGLVMGRTGDKWLKEGRVKSSPDALKQWAGASFVPIKDSPAFLDLIRGIQVQTNNTVLSAVQTEALHASAFTMVMAYFRGTYEAHSAFVQPVAGGTLDPEISTFRADKLKKLDPEARSLPLTTSASTEERWWRFWNSQEDQTLYTNKFCTKCLKEISIDQAKLVTETRTAMPDDLSHYVTSFENYGYLSRRPSVQLRPSAKEVMADEGNVLFSTISFIVKNGNDPPYPIFCRFYWVQKHSKWLPMQFCTAFSSTRKFDYIF